MVGGTGSRRYFGLVIAAPVSVVDQEFSVEFMEPGGVVRQGSQSRCWDMRFEEASPPSCTPLGGGVLSAVGRQSGYLVRLVQATLGDGGDNTRVEKP